MFKGFSGTFILVFLLLFCFSFVSFGWFFQDPALVNSFAFSFSSPLNIFFHALFHSGYEHLLANLFLVLVSGLVVERLIGARHFLVLFFGGAAFSAFLFSVLNPVDRVLGASAGAVSLLVVAFAFDARKTFLLGLVFFFSFFMLVKTISYNVELLTVESKKEIVVLKSQVEHLERVKDARAVVVAETVHRKEDFVSAVEKSEDFQMKSKPDLFIHLFGALFGFFYSFFFLRDLLFSRGKK